VALQVADRLVAGGAGPARRHRLDPRIASEMRQHAEVALRAYELEALEKLDSYERVIAGTARRIG
jgi:hypothetical protein